MKQLGSEAVETPFDMPETPEGWQIALLGQIAQIVGGGTPKTSDSSNFSEGEYPWITPADLSGFNEMYISRGRRSLSEQGLKTSSAVLMPKGTVLMSSRAPIGYLAIAANELCTNQGFKSFICPPGVTPEYVFFWLKFITPFLENMGSGSTFLEISGSRARKIPILLAPTSEQKRIVGKVEELLARVNTAKERLGKVPRILKRFHQAVLAAACSGHLTEGWRMANDDTDKNNWVTADFFDFCVLQRGYDLPISKCLDGPYPIVTSGGIIAYHAQCKMSGPGVLVGRSGSIGKVFYVESDFWPHNTTLYVKNFKGNLPKYVYYFLLGFDFQQFGASTAVPTLNRNNLRNTFVEVPPVKEQHEIVRRVEALFGLADVVEKRVEAATAWAEKLTQAILAKAFRGELVPTEAELARREDRSYESASELLARIKSDRKSKQASHKVRSSRVQRKTV